MLVSDFDFHLPPELIAQVPPAQRGDSRLLVLNRADGAIEHRTFSALPEYLRAGDLVVVNNTRVFPARLLGRRVPSGGAVECLLLTRASAAPDGGAASSSAAQTWTALLNPGPKLKAGARLVFERDGTVVHGEVLPARSANRRSIRLWTDAGDLAEACERVGHVPLPPYIARVDTAADGERYQTVFARDRGSIAAPTAGLHFTGPMLETLAALGVELAEVTLHVGYGTFQPVRVDVVEEHAVEPEWYSVSDDVACALTRARAERRRIIAVGTTTTRVLESLTVAAGGQVLSASGHTRAFIYPGHTFQLADGLITNFHLPRSSLLMLVAAFAGRERVLAAYRDAVSRHYRFYSYGDAMLLV